jgi:hypothetical protein
MGNYLSLPLHNRKEYQQDYQHIKKDGVCEQIEVIRIIIQDTHRQEKSFNKKQADGDGYDKNLLVTSSPVGQERDNSSRQRKNSHQCNKDLMHHIHHNRFVNDWF